MCRVQEGLERVDVVIGFQIDRDFCRSLGGCQGENKTQEEQQQNTAENVDFLLGEFSGRSLKTKIKGNTKGPRVHRVTKGGERACNTYRHHNAEHYHNYLEFKFTIIRPFDLGLLTYRLLTFT